MGIKQGGPPQLNFLIKLRQMPSGGRSQATLWGPDNLASAMVDKTRARKGLATTLPKVSDLSDKLG